MAYQVTSAHGEPLALLDDEAHALSEAQAAALVDGFSVISWSRGSHGVAVLVIRDFDTAQLELHGNPADLRLFDAGGEGSPDYQFSFDEPLHDLPKRGGAA